MSAKGLSRGQLQQVAARVRKALKRGEHQWEHDICVICGKNFFSSACPHDIAEVRSVFDTVKGKIQVGEL